MDETKPKQDDKSAEQIFKNAKDVPQACKDAMNAMSTMSADNPSSYAKRSFAKGSGTDKTQVEVVVETLGKAKDVPAQLTKVADSCKTIKMGTGAVSIDLKMSSPKLETKDAKDYANNLKQFTDQKYDAIVTVGFLMAEAMRRTRLDHLAAGVPLGLRHLGGGVAQRRADLVDLHLHDGALLAGLLVLPRAGDESAGVADQDLQPDDAGGVVDEDFGEAFVAAQ